VKKPNQSASSRAVYDLWPEFGQMLGLGRNATYKAAKTGEIPTIRIGYALKVPKKVAAEKFGI
jgi:hypothetical protein